jgi:hypothetical protein
VRLADIERPAVGAFQNIYCTDCGVMLGVRTGGGGVSGGDTDADVQARIDAHEAHHVWLRRLAAWAGFGQ